MIIEELYELRDAGRARIALRRMEVHPTAANGRPIRDILVCAGGSCTSCGRAAVADAFREAIAKRGLGDCVSVVNTGCVGCCDLGVVVHVVPDDVLYRSVKDADVGRIVDQHLRDGQPVEELMHRPDPNSPPYRSLREWPFFQGQVKVVLENKGLIDPEQIEEYIACDGYMALARALTELKPDQIVDELIRSGLRGRGGGGFPTGRKWQMLAAAPGPIKYVICNGDEGDPGAFMDRSVLESDPHRVLEGMMIAAYATAATHGIIYVRAEYPLAIQRIGIAIDDARRLGLLGQRILGTDFSFDAEIRVGAGAFVCGEETALMLSIEGNRGMPRPRPPYPTDRGLYGHPTIINNVETFANVPPIIRNGSDWFTRIGTPNSTGTKVFALAGAVCNTGLVEVPMGTTLRQLVFGVGGGIRGGRAFKAAQTGGPSGGCIPAEHLDVPLDFDSLQSIGSIMGSGGLIVMDDSACMVDVARYFMEFCVDESCGKCPPCRVGTHQLLRMLSGICEGAAGGDAIDRLADLCDTVHRASLCGLGMTAPNPVLSTLRHFRREYEAHVHDRCCPAGVCRKLLKFSILLDNCTGCGLCARNCPTATIFKLDGQRKYRIEEAGCIQCGSCFDVCRFDSVLKQ